MANVVMVIAPDKFRDEELFDTQRELEKAGHTVTVASTHTGRCTGSRGGHADATLRLADARADAFDAVVFVGGPGARILFDDGDAHALAQAAARAGKVVAAICIAPMILATAGLLHGRAATVFESEIDALRAAGARHRAEDVTVDGNLVTARGPAQARAFGKAIAQRLRPQRATPAGAGAALH